MNGFLVSKQDNPQILSIHFIDPGPATDSSVLLYTSRTGCSTARRIHSSWIIARSNLERIAKKYEVNFTGMILPGGAKHCKPTPSTASSHNESHSYHPILSGIGSNRVSSFSKQSPYVVQSFRGRAAVECCTRNIAATSCHQRLVGYTFK